VAEVDGFVLSEREIDDEPSAIEERHVAALRAADFVWLHVADGYVGPSAALEVGVAHALGIPVYSARRPLDRTIAEFVTTMPSIDATVARVVASGAYAPALPLRDLQEYYKRMAAIRGFTEETPQDTMLLLTEEVGELARSVRHRVALARSGTSSNDPGEELADVQLYLLHLANVLKIDLATAVASKERVNHDRYGRVSVPDAA
jgi:NTP pyrophosphatase (non-canonical NTP hydrolase)